MKTILFSLFLTTTFFCYAQDASNDATWEETINFIKKYKDEVNEYGVKYQQSQEKIINIEFSNSIMTINIDPDEYFWGHREADYTYTSLYAESIIIDLKNLKNISYTTKYSGIYLYTHNDDVTFKNVRKNFRNNNNYKPYYSFRNIDDQKYDYVRIFIDGDEMSNRIAKAFKHLAYLATKKREEERKASGDKF